MRQITKTSARADVFALYENNISEIEICRHTKLSPDYIAQLIQGWEIEKAREKTRKQENVAPTKIKLLVDKPKESNFILCTNDPAVLAAYYKLLNH